MQVVGVEVVEVVVVVVVVAGALEGEGVRGAV